MITDGLRTLLPNVDPQEAINFFVKSNAKSLMNEDGSIKEKTMQTFQENIPLFIETVASFAKNALSEGRAKQSIKDEAYKIAQKGLGKKPIGELSGSGIQIREEEVSEDQKLASELYEMNVNESNYN